MKVSRFLSILSILSIAAEAALPLASHAAEVSTLERAFLKELTFLKAEKAEMEKRAALGEVETEKILRAARDEVDALSTRTLALRRQAELTEEQLRDATPTAKDKLDLVYDTISRADDLLGNEDTSVASLSKDRTPSNEELAAAVAASFTAVARHLEAGGKVRREAGVFYGLDGEKVEGRVVRVGRVAAYGVGADAAGALVPAGNGEVKLFPVPADDAARALEAGKSPGAMPIFLVEAFDDQVASGKELDIAKEVEAAQAANTKDHGIVKTLMNLPIFEAEWVLYLLIIMSIISVGVMVERALFFKRHRVDIDSVRFQLKKHLDGGNFNAAADYLAKYDSLETNVVLFGLREHETGPDSVEDLLRGAEAKERLRYNRWLSFLATVGSNSPFIGLFGTVLGIIRAFADLSGDMGNAGGSVMAGISEALIATAVGLLVAIPAVIAYNAFMGRVKTVLANSELLSRTLLSALKAHDVPSKAG